ncbi:hypothetical protein B566_EDAN014998 [Ephemera danica]|nr:hypothetical protein B566_EDAN014998 [Ephemera danica]
MAVPDMEWPWQYDFPPFFTLQPHNETKSKQLAAWRSLVLDYHRCTKQSVLDVREAQNSTLFFNSKISRILSSLQVPISDLSTVLMILEDLAKTGNAVPLDKMKNRWLVMWHTAEEWGKMVYAWAQARGFNNSVCTLYELVSGDDTVDEEFHGLDTEVLVRALRTLESEKKAELIMFDDSQGVKFF